MPVDFKPFLPVACTFFATIFFIGAFASHEWLGFQLDYGLAMGEVKVDLHQTGEVGIFKTCITTSAEKEVNGQPVGSGGIPPTQMCLDTTTKNANQDTLNDCPPDSPDPHNHQFRSRIRFSKGFGVLAIGTAVMTGCLQLLVCFKRFKFDKAAVMCLCLGTGFFFIMTMAMFYMGVNNVCGKHFCELIKVAVKDEFDKMTGRAPSHFVATCRSHGVSLYSAVVALLLGGASLLFSFLFVSKDKGTVAVSVNIQQVEDRNYGMDRIPSEDDTDLLDPEGAMPAAGGSAAPEHQSGSSAVARQQQVVYDAKPIARNNEVLAEPAATTTAPAAGEPVVVTPSPIVQQQPQPAAEHPTVAPAQEEPRPKPTAQGAADLDFFN